MSSVKRRKIFGDCAVMRKCTIEILSDGEWGSELGIYRMEGYKDLFGMKDNVSYRQ